MGKPSEQDHRQAMDSMAEAIKSHHQKAGTALPDSRAIETKVKQLAHEHDARRERK